jgi:hypothetical protein
MDTLPRALLGLGVAFELECLAVERSMWQAMKLALTLEAGNRSIAGLGEYTDNFDGEGPGVRHGLAQTAPQPRRSRSFSTPPGTGSITDVDDFIHMDTIDGDHALLQGSPQPSWRPSIPPANSSITGFDDLIQPQPKISRSPSADAVSFGGSYPWQIAE